MAEHRVSPEAGTVPKEKSGDPVLREIANTVVEALKWCQSDKRFAEDYAPSSQREKEAYLRKYPDRRQEIEILFGLPKVFHCEQELTKPDPKPRRLTEHQRSMLTALTEYTFTVTNHIVSNSEDQTYLREFWNSLKKIARGAGKGKDFKRYKAGWLGEAAAYHLLDKFELHPTFATPKQDAFKGIDVCGQIPGQELPVAFQVKTKGKFVNLKLKGERYDVYPIADTAGGKLKIYDTPTEDQIFAVHAVNVNLPHSSYDQITGLPTREGIKQFNEQLRILKKTLRDEGL